MIEDNIYEKRKQLSVFLDKATSEMSAEDLEPIIDQVEGNTDSIAVFCDYLELDDWLQVAMNECNFNIKEYLYDLKIELLVIEEENAKEEHEAHDDYLRMVGAR